MASLINDQFAEILSEALHLRQGQAATNLHQRPHGHYKANTSYKVSDAIGYG